MRNTKILKKMIAILSISVSLLFLYQVAVAQTNTTVKVNKTYITTVKNLTPIINQGDKYSLPQKIQAAMNNKTTVNTVVVWNKSSVDTSKSGVFKFLGTVKGYNKKVTLTLTIKAVQKNATVNVKEVKVNISNYAFDPQTVTINKGDTVIWTNQDSMAHTATGKDFDSGKLDKGASFKFTFKDAGTYDYVCSYHASMKGQVIVK
jgi:plastocyanin